MKSNLTMNFTVDKENKKINVEREFAAPLKNVWAAWTEKELLDQWWAPLPWKTVTKSMDFREGGSWFYYMLGPDGTKFWSLVEYTSVEMLKGFSGLDGFCDEEGVLTDTFPRTKWKNVFTQDGSSTTVHVQVEYDSVEDLEKIIEMGFEEGFTSALINLDELLAK